MIRTEQPLPPFSDGELVPGQRLVFFAENGQARKLSVRSFYRCSTEQGTHFVVTQRHGDKAYVRKTASGYELLTSRTLGSFDIQDLSYVPGSLLYHRRDLPSYFDSYRAQTGVDKLGSPVNARSLSDRIRDVSENLVAIMNLSVMRPDCYGPCQKQFDLPGATAQEYVCLDELMDLRLDQIAESLDLLARYVPAHVRLKDILRHVEPGAHLYDACFEAAAEATDIADVLVGREVPSRLKPAVVQELSL